MAHKDCAAKISPVRSWTIVDDLAYLPIAYALCGFYSESGRRMRPLALEGVVAVLVEDVALLGL